MNAPIKIDLMSFACLRSTAYDLEDEIDYPPWARQIMSLELHGRHVLTEKTAALMIEHNVTFSWPEWKNAYFSRTYDTLAKRVRSKTFILAPDEMFFDERENLHRDNGPAVVYGEHKFHFLHGLFISNKDAQLLIYTDPEEIDPRTILGMTNVDLRREMIRKKGVEQMLDSLFHRTLDKDGDYALLQVAINNDIWSACNFLKMLNPSIGCWHMEGVPNNLRTVKEALLWRNQQWFAHAEKIT